MVGVKHTHTRCIYIYCTRTVSGLCSTTEVLSRGREVILLQEVTPREGCLLQEVTRRGLCGESAGVHGGHITPVHMGPRSTGSRPAVNPLTSSSSARVPKALSGLRMGRLIGLQIPHIPTATHPVPIKDTLTSRRKWRYGERL